MWFIIHKPKYIISLDGKTLNHKVICLMASLSIERLYSELVKLFTSIFSAFTFPLSYLSLGIKN